MTALVSQCECDSRCRIGSVETVVVRALTRVLFVVAVLLFVVAVVLVIVAIADGRSGCRAARPGWRQACR